MKTKFTKKGRRILSAALCLLMMVTALPMSAFAWTSEEGKSCTSSFGDYYVGSDGEYYRSKATYSFIVYDSKGNIIEARNAALKEKLSTIRADEEQQRKELMTNEYKRRSGRTNRPNELGRI